MKKKTWKKELLFFSMKEKLRRDVLDGRCKCGGNRYELTTKRMDGTEGASFDGYVMHDARLPPTR